MKANENFLKLESSYLFSTVAKSRGNISRLIRIRKLSAFQSAM